MFHKMLKDQVILIDKVIKERLEDNDTSYLTELVNAEVYIINQIVLLEELIESYPEGTSADNPEHEEPEKVKDRKLQKNRGFYS